MQSQPMLDDPTLVRPERRRHPLRWWAVAVATVVALVAAYLLAVMPLQRVPRVLAITTDEQTRMTMLAYTVERDPGVVLVGSSLVGNLLEPYFAGPGFRNLALAGGDPVTGLEVIRRLDRVPTAVIIETNVLDRSLNRDLLDRFTPELDGATKPYVLLREFRPIRALVNRYLYGWRDPDAARAGYAPRAAALIAQPPAANELRQLSFIEAAWNERPFHDRLTVSAQHLIALADAVEKRGTRVFFLEMPIPAALAQHPYQRETRAAIAAANAGREDRILTIDVDPAELRYIDSLHLDERSAVIVARAIERSLNARLGAGASQTGQGVAGAARMDTRQPR